MSQALVLILTEDYAFNMYVLHRCSGGALLVAQKNKKQGQNNIVPQYH